MKTVILAAGLLLASPALAQDIAPVADLPEMARGQVISSTAKGYADRSANRRARRPSPAQASVCADKAKYRAQYGAHNPKVHRIYRGCREFGL